MKKFRLSDTRDHISQEGLRNGSRLAPAKSIFLVVRGMILAKALPVALAEVPMAFNQDMKALVARPAADPEYLLYALAARKDALATAISTSAHGTRRMETAALESLLVPLPPKDEQHRIASVMGKLDAAADIQGRLLAALRELKAATMAKLFREGLRGEPLKQTEIGEIPSDWQVQPLGSLLTSAQYGLSLRGERLGRYPILRMNCQQEGEVMFRDLQFVDLDRRLLESFKLNEGDILFNRTNSFELVGRTAIFRSVVPAVFASYLVRLTTDRGSLNPDFLNYFMNLASTQLALKAYATRGVSQSNISASKLKQLPVPVPSLSEQSEIVTVLDSLRQRLVRASRKGELQSALFTSMLPLLMTGQVCVPAGSVDEKLRARANGKPAREIIDEIVRRIVEAVAPEKIILFGSAARREMGPDSDLDLLVVKRCDDRREVARAVRACLRGLAPGRGKDVVVVTPADVERDRDTIGYIIRPALREGRVLYAA